MYSCDADGPTARVELDFTTDRIDYFNGGVLGGFKTHTVYDDRLEEFPTFMEVLGETLTEKYGADVSVIPYEGRHLNAVGFHATAYRHTDGVDVSITGPAAAINEFLDTVADAGYGLPQDESLMADWHHPVQSVRGFVAARNAREDLADTHLEVETGEKERHVRYVHRPRDE